MQNSNALPTCIFYISYAAPNMTFIGVQLITKTIS